MRKTSDFRDRLSRKNCVPVRSEELNWWVEDGKVILRVENRGVFNRIAQRLFARPRFSNIHLDALGSFVWSRLDGETSLGNIATELEREYGQRAYPTEERLTAFLCMLLDNNFVYLKCRR